MQHVYKSANILLARDGKQPLLKGSNSALATRFQTTFFEKIDAFLCNVSRQLVDDVSPNVIVPLVLLKAASPTNVTSLTCCRRLSRSGMLMFCLRFYRA